MVVVFSRLEAVRWHIAIDRYIQSQGYRIKTLVAFSGEVRDAQSGPDPFTETSHALNPDLRKRDIREAFATDDYQILLVTNKFQTGFDQPLLAFGREREGIDLSKVILTYHTLKHQGKRTLSLNNGEYPKLRPLSESGSGLVQEKEKVYLYEIIARVNDLFEGDIAESDRLIYVNNVIKGKLLESAVLVQQAVNNSKEQFANSPDLSDELMNAIMDALVAHSTMSKQVLDSEHGCGMV